MEPKTVNEKIKDLLNSSSKFCELPEWLKTRICSLVDQLVDSDDFDGDGWAEWEADPQYEFCEKLLMEDFQIPSAPDDVISAEANPYQEPRGWITSPTREDHWNEDPKFPVEDWAYEAGNHDTRLGYADWVNVQYEVEAE